MPSAARTIRDFIRAIEILLDRFLKGTRANLRRRTILFALLFLFFLLGSMAGHDHISRHYEESEYDPSPAESFFWTISTASTLGTCEDYLELRSDPGMFFTAIVVIAGIGYIFMGVPILFMPWLERRIGSLIKPRLPEVPAKGGHVIVCGFSQTAQAVIDELTTEGYPFVVIADFKKLDSSPPVQPAYPLIEGDAGDSAVLEKAGVGRASSAILLESDEDNAFISLSCDHLNPDLHTVAAAWDARNIPILEKANATKVISPKVMEGVMLGRKALKEHDIDISGELSITGMKLFQHIVDGDSPLSGKDIRGAELGKLGIIIVGLWHEGKLLPIPSPDTTLHPGDILIILAPPDGIDRFKEHVGG